MDKFNIIDMNPGKSIETTALPENMSEMLISDKVKRLESRILHHDLPEEIEKAIDESEELNLTTYAAVCQALSQLSSMAEILIIWGFRREVITKLSAQFLYHHTGLISRIYQGILYQDWEGMLRLKEEGDYKHSLKHHVYCDILEGYLEKMTSPKTATIKFKGLL